MIDRRLFLAAAPSLALAGAATAQNDRAPGAAPRIPRIGAGDVPIGSAAASVQVIEYASFSCPHCAAWNAEVWPAFRRRYVDTGLVRFALRELLTDPPSMAAAGAIVARCAEPARYYDAADALFAAQQRLFAAERPIEVYAQIGARAGLSATRVTACLTDRGRLDALNARVQSAVAAGIDSTPTFVLNGRKLGDDHSLAALSAAIDPLLTPAQRARLPA